MLCRARWDRIPREEGQHDSRLLGFASDTGARSGPEEARGGGANGRREESALEARLSPCEFVLRLGRRSIETSERGESSTRQSRSFSPLEGKGGGGGASAKFLTLTLWPRGCAVSPSMLSVALGGYCPQSLCPAFVIQLPIFLFQKARLEAARQNTT